MAASWGVSSGTSWQVGRQNRAVKLFKNENKEEFSKLANLESKLVEEVLKLVKEKKTKEIGEKINQNQISIIGGDTNEGREVVFNVCTYCFASRSYQPDTGLVFCVGAVAGALH